jgi:hypothetical protein
LIHLSELPNSGGTISDLTDKFGWKQGALSDYCYPPLKLIRTRHAQKAETENAISSRAPWSPISQTSKNSKFKVSKKFKKIS